ncbi:tRNA (adenine(22)-N(1))-methyltransferase [Floccifex sp.]|uniref:tRNA (adenine(22)-N(1))-methyltransferase n=1 Tax=Floccifex sp. TaxID=2815810 RepID=UPI003F03C8E6
MISKRLQEVVNWIDGNVLADIGCDHGYVCIQAILEGRVQKAYACDIAQGPLDNALVSIQKHGLEDKIECVLSNGLKQVKEDVDIIVIAGMGASTIVDILKHPIPIGTTFVISPHKDVEIFRQFACENGFEIICEKMIQDDHFYPIIKCKYTSNSYNLSQEEIFYGKNVLKDDCFQAYLDYQEKKWTHILQWMPENKKENVLNRLESIKKIR